MTSLSINPAVNFGNTHAKTENSEKQTNKSAKCGTTKALLVGTAVGLTAGAAISNRKSIGKVLKKGFNNIKNLIIKQPKKHTIFDSTPGYSNETKKLIHNEILDMFSNETIATKQQARKIELQKMKKDAQQAFKNLKA